MRIVAGLTPLASPGSRAVSDEEMTFTTYRGYLAAICSLVADRYPHSDGLLAGVAAAVKDGSWRLSVPAGTRALSARAGQFLRNGWATEILLRSPRVIGGPDIIGFANHWAPVQAYYAVFEAFNAYALAIGLSRPPKTHAALLQWAADQVAREQSPFVLPWTMRAKGAPGAWSFDGCGSIAPATISNLAAPTAANAPHLVALALSTTRRRQIDEHRAGWIRGLPPTAAGTPRKVMPAATLSARATAMRPTTLFDLLYRLRIRSNYQEADAFLSGALTTDDAAEFHDALTGVVAATLLTTEIYLAHIVGRPALEGCLAGLAIPASLEPYSVRARTPLW